MSASTPNAGTGYTWTQTEDDLTLIVTLPEGLGARDVKVDCAGGSVTVARKNPTAGDALWLVHGKLSGAIKGSVWSVESGTLSIEIEKAARKFWPCAVEGDAEVDVAALIEKQKRDAEPAYKPDPNAEAVPRQVTDKQTLRELKAEFPQLDLPIDAPHTATHQNFAGPRRAFDWGPIPSPGAPPEPARQPAPQPARQPAPQPPASVSTASASASAASTATPEDGKYSWGASPQTAPAACAPSTTPQADGKFSWGSLPIDVADDPYEEAIPRKVVDAELMRHLQPTQPPPMPSRQLDGGTAAAIEPKRTADAAAPSNPGGSAGPYQWGELPKM